MNAGEITLDDIDSEVRDALERLMRSGNTSR